METKKARLTAHEQAQLDVMRAVGFPVKVYDGVYEFDTANMGLPLRMETGEKRITKTITDDFSMVQSVFAIWKKYKAR